MRTQDFRRQLEDLAESLPSDWNDPRLGVRARANRRRNRRRWRRLVAGAAAMFALAAVVGLGVSRSGQSHRRFTVSAGPPTTAPPATGGNGDLLRVALPAPTGVAAAAGRVWVVGDDSTSTRPSWYLASLDARTAAVVSRTELTHPAQHVAVGAGVVWVEGGGDGAYPDGGVTTVDATTGRVIANWGYDRPRATYQIADSGSAAWVSLASPPSVVRLDLRHGAVHSTTIGLSGQPTDVVVTGDHDAWVSTGATDATHIDTTANQVVTTAGVPGFLVGPGLRPGLVWVSDIANRLLIELNTATLPALSASEGVKISNLAARAAASTAENGLFVADTNQVVYFAPTALARNGSTVHAPTSTLAAINTTGLSVSGDSVWFADTAGGLVTRWTPPATSPVVTPSWPGGRPSTTATIKILNPTPNEVTGPNVKLQLQLVGGTIAQVSANLPLAANTGHIHLYLDNTLISMSQTLTQSLLSLPAGLHTIRVEFVANDHLPWNPRVFAEVAFHVQ